MSDSPTDETENSSGSTGLTGLSGVNRIGVLTRPPLAEDEGRGIQPPPKIDIKEHEAKTASTLTFVLVAMLCGSFVVQETLVVIMAFHKPDVIPTLEHIFNQWLPVLAGLVGTAVGFYLKERK